MLLHKITVNTINCRAEDCKRKIKREDFCVLSHSRMKQPGDGMKLGLCCSLIHVRHWMGSLVGNKKRATVQFQPFSRYPLGILKGKIKPQVGSILTKNLHLNVYYLFMLMRWNILLSYYMKNHMVGVYGESKTNYWVGNRACSEL